MSILESLAIAYSKIRTWLFVAVAKLASLYYYFLSSPGVQCHEDVKNDITQGLIYSVSKDSHKGSRFFHAINKLSDLVILGSDDSHCRLLMRQAKPSKATCVTVFCSHIDQYKHKILHVTPTPLIPVNGNKIRRQDVEISSRCTYLSPFLTDNHGELYCSLPNPRNVHFESINMKNVLHWSAPEGTGEGVLYKVKYSVYGVGKWIRKPECRNINRTWCDLSIETSDYEEQYYASVKAFLNGKCSDWMETTRFNPLTDTKIDPPMVIVSSTEKSISIILTAPEKWKRSPEGESVSLLQVYPGLQYNVSVLNKKTKKRWFFSVSNSTLVVPRLEPGTAYCVSAQIHVTTPLLHSGFSKEYCIATLKDKTADEIMTIAFGYVLPIMLAVLFISMPCYCVHRYLHVSKQKHPTNLVWHYTDKCKERVFAPCEKVVINLIALNMEECMPSQESNHLSERKSPRYYTVGKDLPSKEVLEKKHLLDISHEEEILAEGDQTGNWPSYGQPGTKNTLRRKNAGTVEYEHDVRAEDFSPGQKLEDFSLKEKTFSPKGLLGETPIALEDFINMKTGQPYCPQLEVTATDPCLGQEIEELNLRMVDAADELLGDTHINLVDLDTEKSGQTPSPQLEEIVQGLMEKEGEQTILVDWDPCTGRLYIPTLCSLENQVCEEVLKRDDPGKEVILSRLYEKELSDKSSEDQESCLLQFKEQWELHVEMED